MFSYFANPERFERLARVVTPWAWGVAAALFAIGLPWALVISPPDYQQSETVRIMYVHVPSAWLAMAAYAGLGVSSFIYFIWRHNLADLAARALAPAGAVFAALCLATGALWGRPMWGALVGVGCAPDLHAGAAASVSGLYGAARRHRG